MAKQKFLCNEKGYVVPMRDIFMDRPRYSQFEITVPDGIIVERIIDGTIVDKAGNQVKMPKVTKKKAVKTTPKPAPAAKDDSVEDIINGLDGK